jgi:flagellar hook assembly protein FlgD
VTWDGRNDSGQVVPPGRYTATLKTLNRSIQTPLTIVR